MDVTISNVCVHTLPLVHSSTVFINGEIGIKCNITYSDKDYNALITKTAQTIRESLKSCNLFVVTIENFSDHSEYKFICDRIYDLKRIGGMCTCITAENFCLDVVKKYELLF